MVPTQLPKKPPKCIGKYGPVPMDGVGEPDPT